MSIRRIKNPSSKCPKCGSDDLAHEEMSIDGETMTAQDEITCDNCNFYWTNYYKLIYEMSQVWDLKENK